MPEPAATPSRAPRQRRHLTLMPNRAVVPALVEAIDRLDPEHPNYAFWRERRQMLAIALEVLE